MRDPFILKDGDYWYLTGTMCENSETPPGGVPLYKSKDLKTWTYIGLMAVRPDDSQNKWYQRRFWAPEIFQRNGKYYITVNCCKATPDWSDHGILICEADNIEGPYKILNDGKPLALGNDAHLFCDDDGKVYLYASDIWAAEIDLGTMMFLTSRKNIIKPVKGSAAWNGQREGVGFEGPYVVKRDNILYVLFYLGARV